MPQAFFSHNTRDKKIVLEVVAYLRNSLVRTWIDQQNIPGGKSLMEQIATGINKSQYFLAFMSNDYLQSAWCMDELEQAYVLQQKSKVTIIPILLVSKQQLDQVNLPPPKRNFLDTILARFKWVEFDSFNIAKSQTSVAEAIWQNEAIRFEPVKVETIGGVQMQVINFKIPSKDLPATFLHDWDFNILDFVAENTSDQKPLQVDLPVAFNGAGPNWIFTFMTIPLKNLRTVFVFNTHTKEYICIYALKDGNYPGKVLK